MASTRLSAGLPTSTGVKVGAACAGASTLYGTASGCTAGAKALGSGFLNQSKIALSIDISYQLFNTDTSTGFKIFSILCWQTVAYFLVVVVNNFWYDIEHVRSIVNQS